MVDSSTLKRAAGDLGFHHDVPRAIVGFRRIWTDRVIVVPPRMNHRGEVRCRARYRHPVDGSAVLQRPIVAPLRALLAPV